MQSPRSYNYLSNHATSIEDKQLMSLNQNQMQKQGHCSFYHHGQNYYGVNRGIQCQEKILGLDVKDGFVKNKRKQEEEVFSNEIGLFSVNFVQKSEKGKIQVEEKSCKNRNQQNDEQYNVGMMKLKQSTKTRDLNKVGIQQDQRFHEVKPQQQSLVIIHESFNECSNTEVHIGEKVSQKMANMPVDDFVRQMIEAGLHVDELKGGEQSENESIEQGNDILDYDDMLKMKQGGGQKDKDERLGGKDVGRQVRMKRYLRLFNSIDQIPEIKRQIKQIRECLYESTKQFQFTCQSLSNEYYKISQSKYFQNGNENMMNRLSSLQNKIEQDDRNEMMGLQIQQLKGQNMRLKEENRKLMQIQEQLKIRIYGYECGRVGVDRDRQQWLDNRQGQIKQRQVQLEYKIDRIEQLEQELQSYFQYINKIKEQFQEKQYVLLNKQEQLYLSIKQFNRYKNEFQEQLQKGKYKNMNMNMNMNVGIRRSAITKTTSPVNKSPQTSLCKIKENLSRNAKILSDYYNGYNQNEIYQSIPNSVSNRMNNIYDRTTQRNSKQKIYKSNIGIYKSAVKNYSKPVSTISSHLPSSPAEKLYELQSPSSPQIRNKIESDLWMRMNDRKLQRIKDVGRNISKSMRNSCMIKRAKSSDRIKVDFKLMDLEEKIISIKREIQKQLKEIKSQ